MLERRGGESEMREGEEEVKKEADQRVARRIRTHIVMSLCLVYCMFQDKIPVLVGKWEEEEEEEEKNSDKKRQKGEHNNSF